jgi:hypothetical protein
MHYSLLLCEMPARFHERRPFPLILGRDTNWQSGFQLDRDFQRGDDHE